MLERYINPFTDFGFKKLFGEEVNKDLLIDFLNEVLQGKSVIRDLTYLKTEQLGNTSLDRRAIFDLYCEDDKGEKIIIELQKVKQEFFKDRSIFYATFPIQAQAQRGEWDYSLKAIYTIGIMDFVFEDASNYNQSFRHEIKLVNVDTCKVFYDKLTFLYFEMPKFQKEEKDLQSKFDKWLYVLKNLVNFQNRPAALQGKIFEKLFEVAEIAAFQPEDRLRYEDSVKAYRDFKNSINTAVKEDRIQIAKNLKKMGLDAESIAQATGLSLEIIAKIEL